MRTGRGWPFEVAVGGTVAAKPAGRKRLLKRVLVETSFQPEGLLLVADRPVGAHMGEKPGLLLGGERATPVERRHSPDDHPDQSRCWRLPDGAIPPADPQHHHEQADGHQAGAKRPPADGGLLDFQSGKDLASERLWPVR